MSTKENAAAASVVVSTRPRRRTPFLHRKVAAAARPPRIMFWFCAGWLALMVLVALTVHWLPLKEYAQAGAPPRLLPLQDSSWLLGTDQLGRDMLSRLAHGARVSLVVSVCAVAIGMFVGGLAGISAGYFRGAVDVVIGVLIDSALAFPPLILLLAITSMLTPSLVTLTVALSLLAIPPFARLARANTLPLRNREYVLAARAMGARDLRIIFREIVPGVVPPLIAYSFIVAATVIVAEGSLSFLGLGIPPPTPSWGGMIAAGRPLLADSPQLVFVPALALILTVHSLNVVGNWARDRAESPGAAATTSPGVSS